MAVGFTPKHVEGFSLNDLTQEEMLVLANEAAKKMGWKVGYISLHGLIAYTDNGMFSRNAEIKVKIENGTAQIRSASTGSEMMDMGSNKKNVKNFISTLSGLKPTFTKEELEAKYQELKEHLVSPEDDILKLPPPTTADEIKGVFAIFKPTQGFFITPILIDLNIIIFILMVIGGANIMLPSNEILLQWGANFRPMTLDGGWWRLITACFLHIGIFHLLMNMYALLYIGVLLEPHLGRARFITAYLLTGLTASIASLWWHSLTISAGASGAIFGMYGVFLAMLTTDLIEKTARKSLLTSITIFVGYNLLFGLAGGIDNAAHIGGLIGGLIIGYAFIPSLNDPEEEELKIKTIAFLIVSVIGLSFLFYKNINNDIVTYDAKIKEFVAMESMALEIYNRPQNGPKDELLSEIETRGIYYWKENIKLIESFKEMDLPQEIKDRNQLLKEYCELRIKSYELLYKTVSEGTEQYNSQIESYNKQIEAKINAIASKRK